MRENWRLDAVSQTVRAARILSRKTTRYNKIARSGYPQ